jgi:aspartate racemase
MKMKKIGIVGGVGWPSTAEYYSGICRKSERWHLAKDPQAVPSTPEMCIESLDLNKAFSYIGRDDNESSWQQFDDYHRAALQRLVASGADFAVMACNSAHHRFASIVRGIDIPVLSILDAITKECVRLRSCEVLILGTALVMRSPRFRESFAKHGIEASGPNNEALRAQTVNLLGEIQLGRIDGAAKRLGTIAKQSFQQQFGAQPVVCLACTELPLAFPDHKMLATFDQDGVVYINSTVAHINAAFEFAIDQPNQ